MRYAIAFADEQASAMNSDLQPTASHGPGKALRTASAQAGCHCQLGRFSGRVGGSDSCSSDAEVAQAEASGDGRSIA